MLQLVIPSEKHKKSLLEAAQEFKNDELAGKFNITAGLENLTADNFAELLQKSADSAKGFNLPAGYVPSSEYWLVDGNEFIGRVKIRHRLTEELKKVGGHIGYTIRPSKRKQGYGTKILSLALEKAKEIGIDDVLVTCDYDNTGSKKIIEKNGGKLIQEAPQEIDGKKKLRFWIKL